MKLIVGLGNPGINYKTTRHNVGFMVLDHFCISNVSASFSNNYESQISINVFEGNKYVLCKPQTYMNNSGIAIKKISDFFKLEAKDILVIYDEANIDIGSYKLSVTASHGGHNGIKNIIKEMNNNDFLKLKVGVKNENKEKEIIGNFVLQKFEDIEEQKITEISKVMEKIIFDFVKGENFQTLMNKYN